MSLLLFALCSLRFAVSQAQPQKVPRIGFLSVTSPATIPNRLDAFRQSLCELGYTKGQARAVEYRLADGKLDRVPALAAEMVRLMAWADRLIK